jgi:AraC family transcriptional activator of tynA and feaB
MSPAVTGCTVDLKSVAGMPDTVHSLSTAGLGPKRQIQYWSDALTNLCGQFAVDPLDASTLEARINYTSVSKLKLCQIEASQHRIAHAASPSHSSEHPYVKILFQTYGISYFEQNGCQTGTGRIAHDFVHAAFGQAAKLSDNSAASVAESLIDLLLLPLREADTAFDRVGPEAMYVRAQAFIREHLRDPDLCIDQISASLGCTKRYLHMLFSERGMTVSDYIWRARLQHCRQELEAHAGKTITDIAFSWGFSSSSHFSRVFRKCFGVSPSAVHKGQNGRASPYVI